jgi:hypothetical protein
MKTALLLLGPLALLIVLALAMFGTAGPAGNDAAAQAMLRLLGMVYGMYLIGLSIAWSRRRSSRRD